MRPIITYEIIEQNGDVGAYAIMNKEFIKELGTRNAAELFDSINDENFIWSEDENSFAVIINADQNEDEVTTAIDIVNDLSPVEVAIDTTRIANYRGKDQDINVSAKSMKEVVVKVKSWLNEGVFAPEIKPDLIYPA